MICKNCGVELEEDMLICPLCGNSIKSNAPANPPVAPYGMQTFHGYKEMSKPQKKFTWEIVSFILLSAAIATFIVDFIINRHITWSEYPVAICLAIFCYVSLFAFWNQTTLVEMAGGFIPSSLCLVVLDVLTSGIQWAVKLAIPLLFFGNVVTAALIAIIRKSRFKGINLIAYAFLGAAILCILTDGIISFFKTGLFQIQWSIIVTACTIPVVIALLFLHFRLKKGRSLEKTFHV
jgi:hypothetical protein